MKCKEDVVVMMEMYEPRSRRRNAWGRCEGRGRDLCAREVGFPEGELWRDSWGRNGQKALNAGWRGILLYKQERPGCDLMQSGLMVVWRLVFISVTISIRDLRSEKGCS